MRHIRNRQDRGTKLDGTPSADLCTGCYSLYCDLASMSPEFQHKIRERLRQRRCPACGKPAGFCSCRSCLPGHGEGVKLIQTHNNKKLRRAEKAIRDREAALRAWRKSEDTLVPLMGDEAYCDIYTSLYNHEVPETDLKDLMPVLTLADIDAAMMRPA